MEMYDHLVFFSFSFLQIATHQCSMVRYDICIQACSKHQDNQLNSIQYFSQKHENGGAISIHSSSITKCTPTGMYTMGRQLSLSTHYKLIWFTLIYHYWCFLTGDQYHNFNHIHLLSKVLWNSNQHPHYPSLIIIFNISQINHFISDFLCQLSLNMTKHSLSESQVFRKTESNKKKLFEPLSEKNH